MFDELESFRTIDDKLRDLLLQGLPVDDSYGSSIAIRANNCKNDLAKLVLERAKMRLIDATDNYFRRPKAHFPFIVGPFDRARIIRELGGISEIVTTRQERVTDLDFQVRKHLAVQSVLLSVCRPHLPSDESRVDDAIAYFDGFQPFDYGLVHATRPRLDQLEIDPADPIVPDRSYAIINLFDSRYTITTLYQAFNIKVTIGTELLLIIPYDQRMWTVTAANVIEGAYSYQWIGDDTRNFHEDTLVMSKLLPINFFRDDKTNASLRVRPFGSNKVLTITRDEFVAIFAQGMEEQSFPETRQVSHGFAEVSVINFYPVHQVNNLAGLREAKHTVVPFNKRILLSKALIDTGIRDRLTFAKNLQPPWPYVIDDKLYDKTKKAAVQTRITRNLIVPLIYHLYAHSTHIVFNGAIVTLQKVMSPELICQLTENLLHEVIPIKLKILQAGHIIRTNADISKMQLALSAARAIILCAYNDESLINTENLSNTIYEIFTNPNYLTKRKDSNRSSTYQSALTRGAELDVIDE